jgi:hypothetical protein
MLEMQKITEKSPYEKPVLEVCGSLVGETLCETDDGSGQTFKFYNKPDNRLGHDRGHGWGWGWR